ncbi:hypothetical protein OJAG_04930 [Oerskovia enterophila]|uniref:Uncharacterized protein n=1 Tax=Oerskovia enterophila TaxID=43678 RepID=A0A163SV15_9CELL|nr:hypothetical protein OJAG_04930 [Oerskovia enterophila]
MATQPDGPSITGLSTSSRIPLVPTGRRVALQGARAILVAMLLVATLAVAALAAALSATVVILAAPWWIYRLWLSPARDRSPSGTGVLLGARPRRDDDAAAAAPSGV